MKKTIIIIICFVLTVLFSRDVSSQNTELDLPNFKGTYDAKNSSYWLLIEKTHHKVRESGIEGK